MQLKQRKKLILRTYHGILQSSSGVNLQVVKIVAPLYILIYTKVYRHCTCLCNCLWYMCLSRPLPPAKKWRQNLAIIIDQTKPIQFFCRKSMYELYEEFSYLCGWVIHVQMLVEFHSFEIDLKHKKYLYTLHLMDIASKTSFQETLIFFLP
jgi:hypothetical protein